MPKSVQNRTPVVYLIGGEYETRVRRPHETPPHPLPHTAEVIVLPMMRDPRAAIERVLGKRKPARRIPITDGDPPPSAA